MPRARNVDNRFDLRGGVNTQMSQDLLDLSEVRGAVNARQYVIGTYEKRTASQRMHDTQLEAGDPILGVYSWRPAARQIVALVGGNLYYKGLSDLEFTQVAGTTLSLTNRARFATYRDAAIRLYIADGALHRFSGTVLTESIAGAPAAIDVCIYKGRGFCIEEDSKTLFISDIRDLDTWEIQQDVETYDMEPLTAIAKCGSSLLLAKENSIARYTGIAQEEIRIDVETEGVAMRVGCIARRTFIELDGVVFTLSDKGPYLVSESGVEPVNLKVAREFDFANRALWANATAAYHQGRQEVQLSLPATGETENETTWVLNLKTMQWDGPFIYTFGVSCSSRLELADGSESIIVGGYDGWVRNVDVPGLTHVDDALRDGTAGTEIVSVLTYPELLGGAPGLIKALSRKQTIRADLGATGVLEYEWSSELGSGSVTVPSKGAGVRSYAVKFRNAKGTNITRVIRESTANPCLVSGIQSEYTYSRKLRQ